MPVERRIYDFEFAIEERGEKCFLNEAKGKL